MVLDNGFGQWFWTMVEDRCCPRDQPSVLPVGNERPNRHSADFLALALKNLTFGMLRLFRQLRHDGRWRFWVMLWVLLGYITHHLGFGGIRWVCYLSRRVNRWFRDLVL
jgi:hypothetical protein